MEHDTIKRYALFIVTGGVLVGVWGAPLFPSFYGVLFVFCVGLLGALFLWMRSEQVFAVCMCIVVVSMCVGMVRMQSAGVHIDPVLTERVGGSVVLEGVIVNDPEERLGRIEYRVGHVHIEHDDVMHEVGGKVLVKGELGSDFSYGDRVKWKGTLSLPTAFETETGRVFDYPGFLRKDGVVAILSFARGEKIDDGYGNIIMRTLFSFKHHFMEQINRAVPVPESVLAGGLLLGERGSFTTELTHAFRVAGLIHIVVLSGYNISIISEYVLGIFRKKFRKRIAILFATICIIAFALLVGGGATVVRATIMGFLVLLARYGSRRYSIERALSLAVLSMIVWNPLTLTLDVSFHLSLLATLGLIYVAPHIERYVGLLPEEWGIREAGVATIATQIFVLPYLVYRMGEVSLVAPLVNILVLPIIPLAMLISFCVGIIGIVSSTLAYVFGLLLTPILSYVIFMSRTFASLPFASFILPELSFVFVVLCYCVLCYGLWMIKRMSTNARLTAPSEAFEVIEYQIIK